MILKGTVSSVEADGIRVMLPDRDRSVSAPLKMAEHVGPLAVNDRVAVITFSDSMTDGLIIAKFS